MADLKNEEIYPALPLEEWRETNDTLHLWTQIVGKIRRQQTPMLNEWWNVPLYLSPRGLTTSAMPYKNESFAIDFDFVSHQLIVQTSFNDGFSFKLEPMSVADFYNKLMNESEIKRHRSRNYALFRMNSKIRFRLPKTKLINLMMPNMLIVSGRF